MTMWILTLFVAFVAGYVASVYSWPSVKLWIDGAATEAARLREHAAKLAAKLRNL